MELFIHGGVYSGVIYSGGVFSGGVYSGGIYSELFIPGLFIHGTARNIVRLCSTLLNAVRKVVTISGEIQDL